MSILDEQSLLELLDIGLDPVCEYQIGQPLGDHGVTADWLMTLSCCGASAAYCEPHRCAVVDLLAQFKGLIVCAKCGTPATPVFVPIRAGR